MCDEIDCSVVLVCFVDGGEEDWTWDGGGFYTSSSLSGVGSSQSPRDAVHGYHTLGLRSFASGLSTQLIDCRQPSK